MTLCELQKSPKSNLASELRFAVRAETGDNPLGRLGLSVRFDPPGFCAEIDVDSERYRKIKELFHEACELQPQEQRAFLDAACGGDDELKAGVAELLEADSSDSTPLEVLSPQE